MNKTEATEILDRKIMELRTLTYEHFRKWLLEKHIEVLEVKGAAGVDYQIEIEAHWDSPKKQQGNIRVFAAIDDGRFPAAFLPLCKDFIIAPDSSFVE